MRIPILIEPIAESRYRATGGVPFVDSVEADSPEAAIAKLQAAIEARLSGGGRIASLDLSASENPWLEGAGIFRSDPLFDEWQGAVQEYRREANLDPDAP
jgi:hypothetical protein